MTPEFCQVKHDPAMGTHGDCYRACIASILDLSWRDVPHFYADTQDPNIAVKQCNEWLAERGYALFHTRYDPHAPLEGMLEYMGKLNGGLHYILYCKTSTDATHVVVCKGDKIVHDPAWYPHKIIGPPDTDGWQIDVIVVR